MMRKEFVTTLEDADLIQRGDKIRHWLSEISGMIPRLNEGDFMSSSKL